MADYRELSTDPTIKVGAVAPTTADNAMVVGLHPSSPLPAGTNTIGAANINLANTSASTVLQNAAVVTGNGASMTVTGYGTTVFQVIGTFVASIAFETSVDAGVTWAALSATQVGQGDIFSVASLPGIYRTNTAGLDLVRARVTWTSGTSITVTARSSNAVNASKIVKLATSGLSIGTVQMATLAKGVQGATGVSTQDLKDAGRVSVAITGYQMIGVTTTEGVFASASLTSIRDGGTASPAFPYSVTVGKRFAIQSIIVQAQNNSGVAGTAKLALRYLGAGGTVVRTTAPLLLMDFPLGIGGNFGPLSVPFPDGLELIGGSSLSFTNLSPANTWVYTVSIIGFEY